MRVVSSIFISIVILIGLGLVFSISDGLGVLAWLGTIVWAGVDAKNLEIHKFDLNGPSSPLVVVIGCLIFWVIVFPWYLVNRDRVLSHEVMLKPGHFTTTEPKSKTHPESSESDHLEKLEKLASLKDRGILSDDEFRKEKEKLLN